jgi:hypothetical protein
MEKKINCLSIQREDKLWTYIYKRQKENSMPTAKAGAQCRVPVPSPPRRHGGRRGRWGQARLVGAGEAGGGSEANGAVSHRAKSLINTPRLVVGAPRFVAGAPRCSQVHPKFSPALRGVPKLITITPMVLLYQSSEISVTLKAGRNALLGSDTLLQLTHLSLHSTSSQTLLEAPRD